MDAFHTYFARHGIADKSNDEFSLTTLNVYFIISASDFAAPAMPRLLSVVGAHCTRASDTQIPPNSVQLP